jgi:EAL and modified HD-GYP domain-containing signal transduction protein
MTRPFDPLPVVELLADRKRAFGGLAIDLSAADRNWLELPALHELIGRVTCFGEGGDADLAARWLQLGGKPAVIDQWLRPGPSWPAVVPPGIEWVAGDWYLEPPAKPSANQLATRAVALRLMQLVAADAETVELEAVFRQDPSLSYQLLRLVNSPGVGVGRKVSSFSQAIVILGRQPLRRWLNLLLFAARKDDPRASMLLARAASRARRMELIEKARGSDRAAQDRAFMAGMFSLLGTLFGVPLPEVLKPLNLGEDMEAALCRREGALGALLDFVQACESAAVLRGEGFAACRNAVELDDATLAGVVFESLGWMAGIVNESSEGSGVGRA